jgi:glycosyltransferase involved in cell wall biosynthesis
MPAKLMNNEKETIAVICDRNPHTSFGRITLDLRKALCNSFDIYTIWLATPKYFPDSYNLPDGNHTIRAPNLESGWLLFRRPLRDYLKKIKADKAILIHQGIGYLADEIRRTLPKAWIGAIIHDLFPHTLHAHSVKYKLFYKYFISPVRTANYFLYNSEYTKAKAERVWGQTMSGAVIGCPIDRSVFKPSKEEKSSLKQKWGLGKYKGVCLNISLDEPRKNIATFFALAKERPDVAFVRVGPFSKWMKKWIGDNHVTNIVHHSKVPQEQLLELYGCADLFIYPSFLEGFGMPPVEALACGVPAVAAKTSALTEMLDGVIPLIDPPDRVDGYLEVIDDALSGKNIVNREATDKLLDWCSIESFGERVRSCFRN